MNYCSEGSFEFKILTISLISYLQIIELCLILTIMSETIAEELSKNYNKYGKNVLPITIKRQKSRSIAFALSN